MSLASTATQLRRATAHYILRLYVGSTPFSGPVPGVTNYQNGEIRLPIPPQQVKLESQARTHITPLGVDRIADEHGVTPPDIVISGTTGQAAFGSDPTQDGRAWQRDLEGVVRFYLTDQYRRGSNREPLLTMTWHDTYRGEHWVVSPQGVPYGEQDASNPYRERYSLRLHGLRPYTAKPEGGDPLQDALDPRRHGAALSGRNPNATTIPQGAVRAEIAQGTTMEFEHLEVQEDERVTLTGAAARAVADEIRFVTDRNRVVANTLRGSDPDRYDIAEQYAGAETPAELRALIEENYPGGSVTEDPK